MKQTWLLAGLTIVAIACEPPNDLEAAWAQSPDTLGFRRITGVNSACTTCITLTEMVTLGRDTLEGFLEDGGTMDDVVRDRAGRWWVGQSTVVKVFSPDGKYLRSVGRKGQGPMEFMYAQPVHLDNSGMVHVFDITQGRETLIGPDFTRRSDRRIRVGIDAMKPLPGPGHRYVIQQWIPTAEHLGFPLHILGDSGIIKSFGIIRKSDGAELTPESALRQLAVSPSGHIFSAKIDQYLIEAWTDQGSRLAGFELPNLNAQPIKPGVWSWDNPPGNTVRGIAVDNAHRLWIYTRHRRPDWKDHVVELVMPNGVPYLAPKDRQVTGVYRSRIDVVDLNTASMVASTWYDGFLLGFVEPGIVSSLDYDETGAPLLRLLRVTLNAR